MPFTAEVFSDWKGTLLPGDCCTVSVHLLSEGLQGLTDVPCLGTSFSAAYEVDNVGRASHVCTLYPVGGILVCDAGLHVDDPARLAKIAEAGLYGVVVAVLLKLGSLLQTTVCLRLGGCLKASSGRVGMALA